MKTTGELKAEPMTSGELDRWLAGERPRRILVIPFGGPIPSAKSSLGVDLDDEWFDGATDLYGPFPSLRASRERLVDWHHDDRGVPDHVPSMKGAILGRIVLDAAPETVNLDGIDYAGVWADFWANAGEKRRALVARLEARGIPLYGSSEPVAGSVRKAATGHIEVWPLKRHTITTSPQNTNAVVPPLKAWLDADAAFLSVAALRAFATEMDTFRSDLAPTLPTEVASPAPSAGEALAKASVTDIEALMERMAAAAAVLRRKD